VLLILLAATIPRLLHSAAAQYLFGSNKQAYLARLFVIEGAANLALSLALVHPLGLAGVAIGTAVPSLISQGWFLPRFVAGTMDLSVRQLFFEGQARGLAVGVVVALVGEAMARLVPPLTWPTFFTAVLLTVVIASPFLWFLGLTGEDRLLVRSMLARLRPERRPA